MPNINIPGLKDWMDKAVGGAVSYTINSDNDVTITGNLDPEKLEALIRAAKAVGYTPRLASGALKFKFRNF